MKVCKKCKTHVANKAKICKKCGETIIKIQQKKPLITKIIVVK